MGHPARRPRWLRAQPLAWRLQKGIDRVVWAQLSQNVNSYKDNVGSINVRIQLIIQNMRDSAVYFVPLLSPSGSSYAATSSTGDIYYMTADSFAGIEACNAHESDIQATAAACLKSFPTGDLTYLEPGQTSVMIVKYSGGGRYDENGNISFALKFLVRQTIKDDLSVDDLTQKKRAGPPAIISISFPLVPLKEDH